MKSMKKIMAITLCSLFVGSVALATGCNQTQEPQVTNPIISLNGFETQADLSTLTMEGVLGKVELCKETDYVKSGAASAKVTVLHEPYSLNDSPYLYQAANLVKRAEDYTDFAKTKLVTLDVYSANATTERIGLQLVYAEAVSLVSWFTLAPNAWTEIQYNIPRESIPVWESDNGESNFVKGINILYERPKTQDTVFYMDDMNLYKTEKAFEPLVKTLKTDEIASFDEWWQVASLTVGGGNYAPNVKWVKDKLISEGAAIVLDAQPGGTWPSIRVEEEHCALVDWASYSGEDAFTMDVYLPEGQEMEIALTLYGYGIPTFAEQVVLKAGEWNTISFTVDYINAHLYGANSYKFEFTTEFTIGYREFLGTENRQIYVDNIRMVRADNA